MSPLAVGLTVVSFGTSLPELLVSLTSGLRANADLAIANIIGSNIFNVLVVIGVAACIRPLKVQNSTVFSEIPFSLIAALLVGFLANAALFSSVPQLSISRIDGVILLFFFALFVLYVFKISRDGQRGIAPDASPMSLSRAWGLVLLGVVGLYFGGQWCVDGAVGAARAWGVTDALIGLTIVAAGTSLPELVASGVAAYRGQSDLAIGNVVGSNIFNILWILGLTATIVELPFEVVTNTDIVMVIASSTLVVIALVASRSFTIVRTHGILLLLAYLGYLAFVIHRG
jgi:cation:H+ antiporter